MLYFWFALMIRNEKHFAMSFTVEWQSVVIAQGVNGVHGEINRRRRRWSVWVCRPIQVEQRALNGNLISLKHNECLALPETVFGPGAISNQIVSITNCEGNYDLTS